MEKNENSRSSETPSADVQTEVIPFLSLNGRAAEAIAFYEQTLGAEVLLKVSYADMAGRDTSFRFEAGQEDWITHSVLRIGANKIMIAEEEQDSTRPWSQGNEFSLCIQSRDPDSIRHVYDRLTADGRTRDPGAACGQLVQQRLRGGARSVWRRVPVYGDAARFLIG